MYGTSDSSGAGYDHYKVGKFNGGFIQYTEVSVEAFKY